MGSLVLVHSPFVQASNFRYSNLSDLRHGTIWPDVRPSGYAIHEHRILFARILVFNPVAVPETDGWRAGLRYSCQRYD